MKREKAETLALKALGWLVGNEELLPVFLGSSGTTLEEMRGRAADSEFLGLVLDFLLMDDSWVLDFAGFAGIPPEGVMAARQALPGGEAVHWT